MPKKQDKKGFFTLRPLKKIYSYPIFSLEPPSELFLKAISQSVGSDYIACEFCGRQHFSSSYSPQEKGNPRRESIENGARDFPEGRVCLHDASSVDWSVLDGRQYVWDCPCNAGKIYETFSWQHFGPISQYFIARNEEIRQEATRRAQVMSQIAP